MSLSKFATCFIFARPWIEVQGILEEIANDISATNLPTYTALFVLFSYSDKGMDEDFEP
jgi:hypothetical protein